MVRAKETVRVKKQRKGEADLAQLLSLARAVVGKDERLMKSAVRDAFRLSTRLRLRIPREEKRKLCKHCFTYLQPGLTSSTRVRIGRIIITCLNCKNVKRLQYRRGK